jgi:hypothetical protein
LASKRSAASNQIVAPVLFLLVIVLMSLAIASALR